MNGVQSSVVSRTPGTNKILSRIMINLNAQHNPRTNSALRHVQKRYYVAAKATYIRLLYGQKGGFSALAP